MPVSEHLVSIGKDDARLEAEYPWVYRWHIEQEDLPTWVERLGSTDPLRDARARAARSMFRGHRSIEDATRSFDLALGSVRWRKSRIPPRYVYELKRRLPDGFRLPSAVRGLALGRRSRARRRA
jgi:hypothetical protein